MYLGPVEDVTGRLTAEHAMRFQDRADEIEHTLSMAARRDFMKRSRDALVGVDYERGARGSTVP